MVDGHKKESINAVVEMVDAIDQWHKEAHTRLRKDMDETMKRVESNYEYFRSRVELNQGRLETLGTELGHVSNAPVNLDKLVFTPKIVVTIIGSLLTLVLTIVISVFGSSSGQKQEMAAMRSDLRDIRTQMDGQKSTDAAREQLRAVEATAIKNDITEIKRLQQLQQLQLQQVQLQQVTKKGSQ